jgi:hypothetical protein
MSFLGYLAALQRSGRKSVRVALVVGGVAVLGTVLACARSSVTLGSGVTDPPSLAPADGGDTSSAVDASAALCVATACPLPWATCAAPDGTLPAHACGTDLSSDIDHCGACNVACRASSAAHNLEMGCSAGKCQAFCVVHYADCNGIAEDGCESDTMEDPANCGACGVQCPAGVVCRAGKCGCPPGTADCGGACVDLASDDANCGACGFSCDDHQPADAGVVFPHMVFGCAQGQCKDLRCVQNAWQFWTDCNHSLDPDGCEVDLRSDTGNCGVCGNKCEPGQLCFTSSATTECQCKQGQTLCPARPPLGSPFCADTENDPRNCGACGYVCPRATNAKAACVHGRCGTECMPGTADCNGRDDDGCEVELSKDPRNCGSCGAMCDVARGQPCVSGRCVMGDCNGPEAK